jgi:lipoprotein NlpI
MWMFPMVFWLFVIALLVLGGRRRRWRRYAAHWERERELAAAREDTIQHLEVRLARLEERLDFTEKLLMERGEAAK